MKKQIFLVRGLIREASHWGKFIDHLKAVVPDAEVHCLEIFGTGKYYKNKSPLDVKKMVELMREDYRKIADPKAEKIIVAISLGGMVTTEWMRSFPGDFQKAILVNTSFAGLNRIDKRLKPLALINLLKVPVLKGKKRERAILEVVSNRKDKREELTSLWHEIQKNRPVSIVNTFSQLIAGAKFNLKKFKPSIPVLVVAGEKDRMVSWECSRDIANYWQVPLHTHTTAGHDLSSDEPEWLAREVLSFLT
jgi:pimeloyl-[acyl-carrier protein] methyl ester esterase